MFYGLHPRTMGMVGVLGVAILAGVSQAGSIRHDVSDSLYLQLAAETQYAACGCVRWDGLLGSGTLVANQWVLTAAHVVEDATPGSTTVSFSLGPSIYDATVYEATEWYIHPDWTGSASAAGDLALIHLSEPVVDAQPAQLYLGEEEVDLEATIAGYGITGNGLTGASGSSGTKRAGNNLIGGLGSVLYYPDELILADFDYPDPEATGKAICLDLEYLAASGDSGGGWFVDVEDQTYLAGVTSFATAPDGIIDFDYGDVMAATRVGQYLDWIDDYVLLESIPGDLNGDGFVGGEDLDIVRGFWGEYVDPGSLLFGDPSGDGFVGGDDLDLVRSNWGQGAPQANAVPEPSMVVLLSSLLSYYGWWSNRPRKR